ncbi:hypothetical protein C1645_705471 [Glomus cerebriforme]|uniref:Uncharacterized protein n=1 Tax=Glomus cerebriforme TaxID=658196 RepID=A0A397TWI3_9GLOM|nr:hypothetical protein C1645_705471 [Glomus cerebriforme]
MRKLIFCNVFFRSKYPIFKKNPFVSYVYTPFDRLKPSVVNTSQKQSLTQVRAFTFLASNEPILQFSWTTMSYLFFGVPLGVYLYKVWYVNW